MLATLIRAATVWMFKRWADRLAVAALTKAIRGSTS